MKKRSDSVLSVFDLDNTILSNNCSFYFSRYLVKKKVLPRYALFCAFFYHIKHLFFGVRLRQLHEVLFSLFLKGKSAKRIEEQVLPFLNQYLETYWYLPAFSCLEQALRAGSPVLLLSSSPSFLVGKIASYLKIEEWGATEYAVDRQGVFCGIAKIMEGEEKALFMRTVAEKMGISIEKTVAYSDSIADLPLLKAAGKAVCVNPDRHLRRLCKKNGWDIL
ncbi:MAG: hypothetical protein RLZZ453_617 [Chlamydiota bacterium]